MIEWERGSRDAYSSSEYSLIFEDNFDGVRLGSHWQFSGGIQGCGGNNPDNVSVNSGVLKLLADNTDFPPYDWSGAQIEFWQLNHDVYIEINARNPVYSDGVWPSFWLWSCPGKYQEIDFFEYDPTLNPFGTNMYWNMGNCGAERDENKCQTTLYTTPGGSLVDLSAGYHKYGCEWTASYVKLYIDDHLIRTITPSGSTLIPLNPMFLILSFQLRGEIDNCTPVDLPKIVMIDYVKVYNKNNTALFYNVIPPSQVCKGSNFWTGVAVYPNVTYSWSSNYYNFSDPNSSGTFVYVNSSTVPNQTYPVTVTATFPSGYIESKVMNIFVAEGAPTMPGTISKVRMGNTCYYQARVTANSSVWAYEWKLGTGSWVVGIPTGSYNLCPEELLPNTANIVQVRAKYICNIWSAIRSGTLVIGDPPAGCSWKSENESNASSGKLIIDLLPNPSADFVTVYFMMETKSRISVTIADISGRIVYQNESFMGNELTLDLSTIPGGFYIVECKSDDQYVTKSLIVQH